MWGDIVSQKTQLAKIDANMKNKRRWDWLATEYEVETFSKHSALFANQQNLLCFCHWQAQLDQLKGKSGKERMKAKWKKQDAWNLTLSWWQIRNVSDF